ncbi:MAG: hypothetical protein M3Q07_03145 [Pseudobdellovibrionaceae bacterium]|nr:hypothetical protein [Pseudobdellovibrionaceae bacterium]
MKKSVMTLISTAGLFASFTAKAEIQTVEVNGTVEPYVESFDPATHPKDNNGWWQGPTFSYVFICNKDADPEKCRWNMMHQGGNHFISAEHFRAGDKTFFGTGAKLHREMTFRIVGRDPNLNYRLYATQYYSVKTPDIRGTRPVIGGAPERKPTIIKQLINCKNPEPFKFEAGNWQDNSSIGVWSSSSVTAFTRLTPGDCPSNEFRVIFTVEYAQDISVDKLEIMPLEESPL